MSSLDIIRGRQVIVPLVNRSGGAVAAGDVVVIGDGTNDSCFTTTTTASFNARHIGIAQEAIASLATGRVLTNGYAAVVNSAASLTRDQYLFTSTVAKEATASATRAAGAFGQVLTTGTDTVCLIWGVPDATAAAAGSTITGQTPKVQGEWFTLEPAVWYSAANEGRAQIINIPGPMKLRALKIHVGAAGSGTHQWGLFDGKASATAMTKVAGGTGALAATGWQTIAAATPPVAINAGGYILIWKWPAANMATFGYKAYGAGANGSKSKGAYTWSDTPDVTLFTTDAQSVFAVELIGDIDGSNNQW